jgi:hypothetical protein
MAEAWEYCYLSTEVAEPHVMFCHANGPIDVVMQGLGWDRTLARLGAYGWEVAGVQTSWMYLKRTVQAGRVIDDASPRSE